MRKLLLLLLLAWSIPTLSQSNPKSANNHFGADPGQQSAQSTPGIAQSDVSSQRENKPDNKQPNRSRSLLDYLGIALTIVIAAAACVQAACAYWQARIYKRQYDVMSDALIASNRSAEAAAKGVAALEKLERPFLMIEVRDKTQVWTMNKGKVPAQIIWINPIPMFIWPEYDEELPNDYDYGMHYYDPHIEVINVEWLAPDSEKEICSFPTIALGELGQNVKDDLNGGRRVLYFLSALKYRGMLSNTVYESRWCFRWGMPKGLFLSGPLGYNKYT